jgi:hypothetical protein
MSSINNEDYIGRFTAEKCPRPGCNGFVFVNKHGNRWCSSITCGYHIRDGKQVEIRRDDDRDGRR